ncbi:ROK family transcriptional regulator [Arthrobacter sp. ISL-30]|nr:ROK family transcriptional regulator [Arthrobacter sp. ISL-30]
METAARRGVALPGRVGDVRRGNLALVLKGIAAAGPGLAPTRAQLAAANGLTKASVSSLVADLIESGLIRELGLNRDGERGRPGVGLQLNPQRAVIGLEINVDYLAAGLVDLNGALRFHTSEEAQNSGADPRSVIKQISRLLEPVLKAAGDTGTQILGGGLAVPGLVDSAGRTIVSAPNLHWSSVTLEVRDLLPAAAFDVLLSNEANSAALAELWYGRGRELHDFVFVSGEVGVGAGLVVASELFVGPQGYAGELGHVVVHPDGPDCSCGGRGCLETFAGLEAILSAAGIAASPVSVRLTGLLDALRNGEGHAVTAVENAGRYLGLALVSAARIMDLPAVVLGGHFALLGDWIRPALQRSLEIHAPGLLESESVMLSTLDQSAALLGAAGGAIQSILESPHVLIPAAARGYGSPVACSSRTTARP